MEDTLREVLRFIAAIPMLAGLNPCFNGRYSQSIHIVALFGIALSGLNPCFNGRYSQRMKKKQGKALVSSVLILVLMEDTLRA